MSRLERLTVAMRDQWRLVGEAVAAGVMQVATQRADSVIETWGWDRYRLVGAVCGIQLRQCDLVPRAWLYFDTNPQGRMLLLFHPDARSYFTENPDLGPLVNTARAAGSGLLELDTVLMDAPNAAFCIPDDLADLL